VLQSLAVRVLAAIVVAGLCTGVGALFGYRYERTRWNADTAARDLAAANQQRDTAVANEKNAAETQRVNDEAVAIQTAQSSYIADFLRKPAPVRSSPMPRPAAGPSCPAVAANGPGSGSDHPAPQEPLAFQDPDITGVALAGWEQLRLWRQWCHATPGCVGPSSP
jgi:hypothetical protein